MDKTKLLEMARRLDQFGEMQRAVTAYTLAAQAGLSDPTEKLEAALYILQNEGDYRIAYTFFVEIFNEGFFNDIIFPIITTAFYEPNRKQIKARYENNCKRLKKYPYIFRKDFPDFENLSIKFYPFEGDSYIPFYPDCQHFGECIDFSREVITRNYFNDLENPVLVKDVFSKYELEYLCDNLRKSEYIGKENHLYLHYSDWEEFCSYLQCINLSHVLEEEKPVFLFDKEIDRYPIDFKTEFGIDYSQYSPKPIGIREVTKLIWHTQLSSHNGGDFFNEIFDAHPNLITVPSVMLDNVQNVIGIMKEMIKSGKVPGGFNPRDGDEKKTQELVHQLMRIKRPTEKDYFVTMFMCSADMRSVDISSRICPAIFFQPHFPNIVYDISRDKNSSRARISSEQYATVRKSSFFSSFKYIKTFTPMRRITTSYEATVKFVSIMYRVWKEAGAEPPVHLVEDILIQRVLNRSYMFDFQDRLFKDSILVRFEDGKLNPTATFTALAAFLDIPYTESLTYCSDCGKRNPVTPGNAIGLDSSIVYRTYDEYTNDAERYFLEYFTRDTYQYYGYDFHYYDGAEMNEEKMDELFRVPSFLDRLIEESYTEVNVEEVADISDDPKRRMKNDEKEASRQYGAFMRDIAIENRKTVAKLLLPGLQYENSNGQPLHMMPLLKLDPALLEQPLYR